METVAVLQSGPQYTAVLALVLAAVASPVTAIVTFMLARATKREDWARQDAVADHVKHASLLLEANTSIVNGKLDTLESGQKQIHTLVNSNLTAQMDARLSSLYRELAVLRELAAMKARHKEKPFQETLDAIEAAKKSITMLSGQLKDRASATKLGVQEASKPV